VSSGRYEVGVYIPEDYILLSFTFTCDKTGSLAVKPFSGPVLQKNHKECYRRSRQMLLEQTDSFCKDCVVTVFRYMWAVCDDHPCQSSGTPLERDIEFISISPSRVPLR
jgi:hypothetical protein